MNRDEAKFYLSACLGGAESEDREMTEALALLKSDPELSEWYSRERHFDVAVRGKIQGIAPPIHLKTAILAGRRTVASPHMWRRPGVWAIAAGLVLLLSLGSFSPWILDRFSAGTLVSFRSDMVRYLDDQWDHEFAYSDSEFPKISQWLASQPAAIHFEVPQPLATSPTFGCRLIPWKRSQAVLICFRPQGVATIVHVLAIPRESLPDSPGPTPVYRRVSNYNTAAWAQGSMTYVAITTEDIKVLDRLL